MDLLRLVPWPVPDNSLVNQDPEIGVKTCTYRHIEAALSLSLTPAALQPCSLAALLGFSGKKKTVLQQLEVS